MYQSLLFIPSNKEKMLEKAKQCDADSIIFDLEDSILESDKSEARTMLYDYLKIHGQSINKNIIIRINQLDTFGKDDVKTLGSIHTINAFMLPKASTGDIRDLDGLLNETENENPSEDCHFHIIPMIESPESLLDVKNISTSSKRITAMLFGAEDYTTAMGIERTIEGDEIFLARSMHAIACMAAGIEALDTPCTEISDAELIKKDAMNGKKLGMTGKAAIHPAQLPIINKVFYPDEETLMQAKMIIEASKVAEKNGSGSFSVSGKMVDLPIIERAKKILATVENMETVNNL